MRELAILRAPFSMRSAHAIAGPKTVAGLTAAGIQCEGYDLWPEWIAKWLWHSRIPGRRRLFNAFAARYGLWRLSDVVRKNDWIWISGASRPHDARCAFERRLLRAGKTYIFHLLDDWFSVDGLRELALARLPLANLVVVPTSSLGTRVLEFAPATKVLRLEEPIDVDRFAPIHFEASREPMLVWCGNPNNLKEVPNCAHALERVYREVPFRLRIITGQARPALTLPVPWEWHAYDDNREAELMAGASAGLAPLLDTPYARCKGSYKVKTYLAAGLPPVASPVGHQANIVEHGCDGFLAETETDWVEALMTLLRDPERAATMGQAARQKAERQFSHAVLMPQWAEQLSNELGHVAR
jgi:glycosyltransferase involved in cell wall biosynthesis